MPLIYNKTTIPETSTALTYNGSPVYTVMYGSTKVWEVGPGGFGWPVGQSFGPGGGSWGPLPFDAYVDVYSWGGRWSGVDDDAEDSSFWVVVNGQTVAKARYHVEGGNDTGRATVFIKAGTGLSAYGGMDRKRYEMGFSLTARKA